MLPTCPLNIAPRATAHATTSASRNQLSIPVACRAPRVSYPEQECQQHTVLLPLSSSRCKPRQASAPTRATAGNGNGDRTADTDAANSSSSFANGSGSEPAGVPPLDNGGNGSSGNGGAGSRGPGQPSGGDQNGGNGRNGFNLPLSSEQLSIVVLALAALSALQLVSLLWHSTALTGLDTAMQTVMNSLVRYGGSNFSAQPACVTAQPPAHLLTNNGLLGCSLLQEAPPRRCIYTHPQRGSNFSVSGLHHHNNLLRF
jgi:hypothetical protein